MASGKLTAIEIAKLVQTQYPQMSRQDCLEIADQFIGDVQEAIRRGDRIAAIKDLPSGALDVSYLTLRG